MGLLVFAYGRHWSVICTAAPVRQDVAEASRAAWRETLIGVAGMIAMLIAAMLWTG